MQYMTKKIAVINDLSGFGRCSLTAAISVLSAMGVQACPLPTAVLTAQTGYPSYYCDDYADKMPIFCQEWQKMQVQFDGIATGFVASEKQIEHIFEFLDHFHKEGTFLLVDPVLGDDGKVYDMFSPRLLALMQELAGKADIITPNLTELCLLTGRNAEQVLQIKDEQKLRPLVEEMGQEMLAKGPRTVVVTGIHYQDKQDETLKMGNFVMTKQGSNLLAFPYVHGSYSGTGDLFAAVLTAGFAKGMEATKIIELAGSFIEQAIRDSVQENVAEVEGVNFEKFLHLLIGRD